MLSEIEQDKRREKFEEFIKERNSECSYQYSLARCEDPVHSHEYDDSDLWFGFECYMKGGDHERELFSNFEQDWKTKVQDMSMEDLQKTIVLMHSWVKLHQFSVTNACEVKNKHIQIADNLLKENTEALRALEWMKNTIHTASEIIVSEGAEDEEEAAETTEQADDYYAVIKKALEGKDSR